MLLGGLNVIVVLSIVMILANWCPYAFSHSDDHQILKWDFQSGEATQARLTPWCTFQGLPHLIDCSLFYFQVVQLPKETYATDIHWFPPGVSSKKTSNQSDLFVLACTDGQSAVVRVM